MYFSKIWSDLGTTLEYYADYETLTEGEIAAASFVEESSNAATVTINGDDWTYSSSGGGVTRSCHLAVVGQVLRSGG
jgi:hypothetical protein